jgi:hypothetical protein
MDKLPKDVLCLIGLKLDEYDIANLSNTCKRITDIITRNEMFWMNKIIIERPNFLQVLKDKVKFPSYRVLYNRLINRRSRDIYKWQFGQETINILGKLTNYIDGNQCDNIKPEYMAEFFSDEFKKENWLLHTDYGAQVLVVNNLEQALEMGIREISEFGEEKQKIKERYYKIFEKYHEVKFKIDGIERIVKIERIDVA